MNTTAIILPVVTIQHTFPEVIQEVQDGVIPYDKFWVSCYKASETSIHAKVNAELDDYDRNRVNLKPLGDEIEIAEHAGSYTISCKALSIPPTKVMTPVQEYTDQERSNPTRPHRITAFAVSPDSSRFATGYLDGSVFIYPTSSIEHSRARSTIAPKSVDVTKSKTTSRPHLSAITSLKFFPSSQVILSSGLDFSLAILPADIPDGSSRRVAPVRMLRAHTRAVTDTAIISLGRNIVSSSLDSTIKLWDVSSGEAMTSLLSRSGIACMSLGDRIPAPPDGEELTPPAPTDSRELPDTTSKIVFCGLESGAFELFDLGFKKSTYISSSQASSPLKSIAYSQPDNLLATGSAAGLVTMYDTRALGTPLTSFRRLDAAIEDLAFVRNDGSIELAIATSDGLPYIASVAPEGPAVSAEMVGLDCDPARNVAARIDENHTNVWSSSDDGIVRRYVL